MSENKEIMYVSDMNFGNPAIEAGTVFSKKQWVKMGGNADGLQGLIDAEYVTEWAGNEPPKTLTVDSAETIEKSVDASAEESPDEVISVESDDTKPEVAGVWKFQRADLEGLELEALNTFAKDHAAKFDASFEMHDDKDELLDLMCSQS